MATVSANGNSQSFGGLTAQIGWFGQRVGGYLALSLHSSNEPGWTLAMRSWWQHHKHCRDNYHYYYYNTCWHATGYWTLSPSGLGKLHLYGGILQTVERTLFQITWTSSQIRYPVAIIDAKKTHGCFVRRIQVEAHCLKRGGKTMPGLSERVPVVLVIEHSCVPTNSARLNSATGACRAKSNASFTISVRQPVWFCDWIE